MNPQNLDIKIESVGGMGANLIGKILGETAAMKLMLNATSFSSYGSEKTGSPVTAFVRVRNNHDTIIENTPITHPDILALFHQSFLENDSALAGLTTDSRLIVNTPLGTEPIRKLLGHDTPDLFVLDCQSLMAQHPVRINMLMLGAILKASGNEDWFLAVLEFVEELFSSKEPETLRNNLLAVRLGYEETVFSKGIFTEKKELFPPSRQISVFGYRNTPPGGILPSLGNTAQNNLSLSRNGYIPKYLPEKCIHCGLCDTTCPDMVFTFREGEYNNRRAMINQGPDYRFCKGCLRCVEVCPTQALVSQKDTTGNLTGTHGADPIITSEAFYQENVKEGGLNE